MTKLSWDNPGSRFFDSGIDRGVLYLPGGQAVPWNGLTGFTEGFSGDSVTSYFMDGVKYLDKQTQGDVEGTLKAYTYPDEFLEIEGISNISGGFFIENQPVQNFALSYRTLVGNDIEGIEHGYKIHILYNLVPISDAKEYQTQGDEVDPLEFSWAIHSTPVQVPGYRPTSYAVIDSRYTNPYLLADLESLLYGSDDNDPSLPTLTSLTQMVEDWTPFIITDNGDGTWTATGPDEYFTFLGDGEFQIDEINATYGYDGTSYEIPITNIAPLEIFSLPEILSNPMEVTQWLQSQAIPLHE